MTFKTQYNFGDIVYIVTDPSQYEWQVTGVTLLPGGHQLEISQNGATIAVYEFEISKERDEVKRLKNMGDD